MSKWGMRQPPYMTLPRADREIEIVLPILLGADGLCDCRRGGLSKCLKGMEEIAKRVQ